jgi:hypothetical protein
VTLTFERHDSTRSRPRSGREAPNGQKSYEKRVVVSVMRDVCLRHDAE